MVSILIVVFCLWFAVVNLDKVLMLRHIPKAIYFTVCAIPDLCYAGGQLILAGLCFTFYLVMTWLFWPLALWFIWYMQVKPYTH